MNKLAIGEIWTYEFPSLIVLLLDSFVYRTDVIWIALIIHDHRISQNAGTKRHFFEFNMTNNTVWKKIA